MNPDRLWTHSLRALPVGAAVTRILAAALGAVEPAAAVRGFLRRDGASLEVGSASYDLHRFERVLLFGIGKAGAPMARAAADILGERLAAGVVVVKEGHADQIGDFGLPKGEAQSEIHNPQSTIELIEAGHPVPDERSVTGARRVVELLASATERDLVIGLISGGGSALLTLPAPGVSLRDLQVLTQLLLASGATITEMNALRKHLDQVKGGGLVGLAGGATFATLILSDVIGDPLDVIASGPTVPDASTFAEAYGVLERYGVVARTPPAVLAHLRSGVAGRVPETPKPGDPRFDRVQNVIVGSNRQALDAAAAAVAAEGFEPSVIATPLQGEAREVGVTLARLARTDGRRPQALLAGGETTVTLHGDGRGGRNQEMALAAVEELAGQRDVVLVTLATDGGDGPTDAAGAVVTGATLHRAAALGLDPAASLARNDAYTFFDALGDLLKPGPTQTNVNDLALLLTLPIP